MENKSFWEKSSGGELRQGDFIFSCPVPVFAENFPAQTGEIEIGVDIDFYDLIILTQSCDLEQNKVRLVSLCPIYALENYERINSEFAAKVVGKRFAKAESKVYIFYRRRRIPKTIVNV